MESLPIQQADGRLRGEHEILQSGATASFLLSLNALFLAPKPGYHRGAEPRLQDGTFYMTDFAPLNETAHFATP